MLDPFSDIVLYVISFTWPMMIISSIIIISLRVTYLIKSKKEFIFYKEFLMLGFIIYILCLFQLVTLKDVTSWSSHNFIPFREILRYRLGSPLFLKNVIGNMVLFVPYGIFVSHYLNLKKWYGIIILAIVASISIEITQAYIGRVFDIDDIILNVTGAFIGFLIYRLLRKLIEQNKELQSTWILNTASIIVMILLIMLII